MTGEHVPPGTLTREELAQAVRTDVETIDELLDWKFLVPGANGLFRPSDIARVRAVQAMRSPGIPLDQLIEAFRERLFTLQPMDLLYPEPEVVSDQTPADVAAALGMSEQDLIRLMITAGFPSPVPGAQMREDDIRLVGGLVAGGRALGGDEVIFRFARTFGDAARRAAESGVAMFAENVSSPIVNARISDEERMEVNRLAAELMRSSETLLGELYRRHLEHTLLRQWANSAEAFLDQLGVRPASASDRGLAFVDLTGYTALTESGGDAIAVRLSARLGDLAERAAAAHRGRVVKLLGDGAMLYFEEPLDAVRGALRLVDLIAESDLPAAHAGVHAGPVIERDGDYFGATVNLAARISGAARPGQVLTSAEVARCQATDLNFRAAGAAEMKGVGRIEVWEALHRS